MRAQRQLFQYMQILSGRAPSVSILLPPNGLDGSLLLNSGSKLPVPVDWHLLQHVLPKLARSYPFIGSEPAAEL